MGNLYMQLFADRGQELDDRQLRIEHDRDVRIVRHAIQQQRADQRRLAGTDFAGQLNEAAALGYAVNQVCKSLTVALTQEQVTRIGRYRERLFIESEKTAVHAS